MPAMCLAHLEEESAKKDEEVESKDPDSINGVTGGIHGAPCKGHEGCPSGREVTVIIAVAQSTLSTIVH